MAEVDPDLAARIEALQGMLSQNITFQQPFVPKEENKQHPTLENDSLPKASNVAEVAATKASTWKTQGRPSAPGTMEQAPDAQPQVEAFDSWKCALDQPLSDDTEFCPWRVIETYPDSYIGKANKPRCKVFFDNILLGRTWDFFYLYDQAHVDEEPHLLVPTVQFRSFLESVNRSLDIYLKIPQNATNIQRFYMTFGQGDTPRPRYLKHSTDKKSLPVAEWPAINTNDIIAFKAAGPRFQEDWLEKIKRMKPVDRTARKLLAQEKAKRKEKDRARVLQETQRVLGLADEAPSFDPVLICVDVEALETAPNQISEVGIAVLDTKDIRRVAPGPGGRDWWPMIKCHHLRTKEYSRLRNFRFVQGCPEAFIFGNSAFPLKAELPQAVSSIIGNATQGRDIVLVGHDLRQDIAYLGKIGLSLESLGDLWKQIDTQAIHQSWRKADTGRSLQAVLGDLCMASANLHNAGNDAMYTLRAALGIAIEEIREREAATKNEEYRPALWDN